MTAPTPSWAELFQLMAVGPDDEPTVRGAIRHTGPDSGWMAYGGGAPPVVAGVRPGVDPVERPPLRVWRHGRRVRIEEPDGRVNLIVGDDRLWRFDAGRGLLIESPHRDVHYRASGTQLLERRPPTDYAGDDFTQPAGEIAPTTFLGRAAWTVELAPPPRKPHPMQLVVDAQTGIVLQQRNDGFGITDEWVEFVVGGEFEPDLFTWSGPVMSEAEFQEIRRAEHEAEMARRGDWFRASVTDAPLLAEFELAPLMHTHAADGSFEASLGDAGRFGSLARRPHSDTPWDLHWDHIDRRWSSANWDWALSFHGARPTEASVQALIDTLNDGGR